MKKDKSLLLAKIFPLNNFSVSDLQNKKRNSDNDKNTLSTLSCDSNTKKKLDTQVNYKLYQPLTRLGNYYLLEHLS